MNWQDELFNESVFDGVTGADLERLNEAFTDGRLIEPDDDWDAISESGDEEKIIEYAHETARLTLGAK